MRIETVKVGVIELARKYQRPDGSFQNIYIVPLKVGDDVFAAESFMTMESMERRGIVRGAVGDADIDFRARTWTRQNGEKNYQQQVTLRNFTLANRNLTAQAQEAEEPATDAQPEGNAEMATADQSQLDF